MKITEIISDGPGFYEGYLQQRFGENFAQLSTDYTLKLSSAIHDVSRFMRQAVPSDILALSKRFKKPPQGITDYDFILGKETDEGWVPGSIETDPALIEYVQKYPDDWEIVKRCLGMTRQKGRHASAYIIANEPIKNFIPITSVGGIPVTAFTADSVEAVGGLKFDFLVVDCLKYIQDTLSLVHQKNNFKSEEMIINEQLVPKHQIAISHKGDLFDIWNLPDDKQVFLDIVNGYTETVFQLSTSGAIKWLKQTEGTRVNGDLTINSLEEVAAFVSLNRPGPLDYEVQDPEDPDKTHNILVEYYRRARGEVPTQTIPDIIGELAPETNGLIIYQETLQRIYQYLTDCPGPEAEEFRRKISKKKAEEVQRLHLNFIKKASKKIGKEKAEEVWSSILTFSAYGFNKSHAVCYGIEGYACAWLKHYYPLEWWCSVLKNSGKEKINNKLWNYCKDMVDLPDIQLSKPHFEIDNNRIRAPLSMLHGVGEKAHGQICDYAPYKSMYDFAEKIKIYREKNSTKKLKKVRGKGKGKETIKKVTELGRSALNRSVIYKLIISGCMDSILPKNYTVNQALDLYDQEMKKVFGSKYVKSKKEYGNPTPIEIYQIKKSVLPIYSEDLRSYFLNEKKLGPLRVIDDKRIRYLATLTSRNGNNYNCNDPVIGGSKFEKLSQSEDVPDGGWKCGIIGYIEDLREFTYHGYKQAMALTIDCDDARLELAYWPNENGVLPEKVKNLKKGSIITILAHRFRSDKPFNIKDLYVLKEPFDAKEKDDNGN